ncbi:MAG: hypothetical protein A3A33_01765 [Candidatus Yanofskybacteria bacterium RIFCSPLOWO2_01_FULL_49_25]|uniref:CAAX prenyl protease 2/Lysostaphin resistance protein A-like domain-containing protein n=1 Tax=Candidatus Yanofskybacteria bacterium RIFCSPLOWO2_01_FULL_49_25 TaxID=1802701 RepID=A0A1F8GX84_9BACT|nr:MAG: hypothetical protein A3A33_01765 [Candidatus Yanofskybacteria bacterium RIFCSPLOWO2_01_FULL_49_25]
MLQRDKSLLLVGLTLVALFNYLIVQKLQALFPSLSYTAGLLIPWLCIALVLVGIYWRTSGIIFDKNLLVRNWLRIVLYAGLILCGLLIFVFLGLTKYFQYVQYPVLFFLWIPIIEELIFRGWIYGTLEKFGLHAVLFSSILFALHHLQYSHFHLSLFVLFQIGYTFVLGLILAKIRRLSGSIYLGILLHIFINLITLKL